jgi:hypothetical protein
VSIPSHDDRGAAGNSRYQPLDDGYYLSFDDDYVREDDEDFLVRPYAVTGGRTEPRYQLEIEAMVTAAGYGARDLSVLSPECQAILDFCRDWRSVAEVSAVLQMPLGVARILIADMGAEGFVRIHQPNHAQGGPDVKLLERVLSGLRRL